MRPGHDPGRLTTQRIELLRRPSKTRRQQQARNPSKHSAFLVPSVIAVPRKQRHGTSMNVDLPIEVDPEIMSGHPVFAGTRVPVESLFDYLIKGSSVEEFLDCFPTVKREDVLRVLNHSKQETLHEALG